MSIFRTRLHPRLRHLAIAAGIFAIATTTVGHTFLGLAWRVLSHPFLWNVIALVALAGLLIWTGVRAVGLYHRLLPHARRLRHTNWSRLLGH